MVQILKEEKQNGNNMKILKNKFFFFFISSPLLIAEKISDKMSEQISSQLGDGLNNIIDIIYPFLFLVGVLLLVTSLYGLFIKEQREGADGLIKDMIYLSLGIFLIVSKSFISSIT